MPLDLFFGTAVCLDVTGFAPRTDMGAHGGPTRAVALIG
jgi:hypothetical protein